MARLILLNGAPGTGKSTLARRYADEHPLTLALDIDLVRSLLGGWRVHPMDAGRFARRLAVAMIRQAIADGRDVIIPQLLGRPDFVEQLAEVADELRVPFAEIVVTTPPGTAEQRFRARSAAAAADDPQVADAAAAPDVDELIARYRSGVDEVADARPNTVRIENADGAGDRAYAAVVEAVERAVPAVVTAAHPLDNPLWHALSSRCSTSALRHGRAAVFDPTVSVFGAIADRSEASWHDLTELVAAHPELDRSTCLFGSGIVVPDGWVETRRLPLQQMVLDRPAALPELPTGLSVAPLDRADLVEVTALVELTTPGPWVEHTIDLGGYLGIRDQDRLVAMAGWRIQLDGPTGAWTEVSGVCVHPDQRGRGLAAAITARVAAAAQARGDAVYLHVLTSNVAATRVYERLGFATRAELDAVVIELSQDH